MIPIAAIVAATNWLSLVWAIDGPQELTLARAYRTLSQARDRANPGEPIVASVPCWGGRASVKVWDDHVFGYIPERDGPTLIWPDAYPTHQAGAGT